MEPHPVEPRRIVVRTPNWLGDLMMATGFLRALLDRHAEAAVDLVVRPGFEALPLPARGSMLPFDATKLSAGAFGASLRRGGYDRFYVLPPSFSAAWMAWRSGVPERVGFRGEFRSPLLRPAIAHPAPRRSCHLAREYLDLLAPPPEIDRYPPRLELAAAWAQAQLARIRRELPDGFAAVAPGAVYGPAKAWPAGHYREAARVLRDRAGLAVVVVGTRAEHEAGELIRAGEEGILNWCGATDLPALVAVLSRAELLVSNDSGAMHVMAALGRPQVAIFGSTSPAWTGPVNPRASVVSRGEPCAPCFRRTCRFGHYRCLREIPPEQVTSAALSLLGTSP